MKEANLKRLHIVWLQLFDVLRKGKTAETVGRSLVTRAPAGRREGWTRTEDFESRETVLYEEAGLFDSAAPQGTWALSSPARARACAPCLQSMECYPLGHQQSPKTMVYETIMVYTCRYILVRLTECTVSRVNSRDFPGDPVVKSQGSHSQEAKILQTMWWGKKKIF